MTIHNGCGLRTDLIIIVITSTDCDVCVCFLAGSVVIHSAQLLSYIRRQQTGLSSTVK